MLLEKSCSSNYFLPFSVIALCVSICSPSPIICVGLKNNYVIRNVAILDIVCLPDLQPLCTLDILTFNELLNCLISNPLNSVIIPMHTIISDSGIENCSAVVNRDTHSGIPGNRCMWQFRYRNSEGRSKQQCKYILDYFGTLLYFINIIWQPAMFLLMN